MEEFRTIFLVRALIELPTVLNFLMKNPKTFLKLREVPIDQYLSILFLQ
jgi:hypothetical protein